ncbi:small heat shock protein (HSP20) family [Rhizoctonia solani]|uniref:Small heat shock protein (HSP20) family n=1 Tax=Rhizoctonia solani TaxID=456999 RepID=A0A8H7I809_9AGAM|nr:small heat shock protein (HSP20) family [Rhizoctonia solani]
MNYNWVYSRADQILAGHFERRISFGYDADVAAIRAEFNGDLLRVTVPRRWILGPMGTIGRSTTIGHGPGPGTGTRPAVEQPSNKPLVDTSASGSAESTRLPECRDPRMMDNG